MSELHAGIQRYLGFELQQDTIDFYNVLKLPIGESDSARIAAALKSAIETLKHSRPKQADPEWEAVARCIQQAKIVLLDPSSKAQYDQQLLQTTTAVGKGAAAANSSLAGDLQRFRDSLPFGDPNQPFDLPNFIRNLQKSDVKEETNEERLSQMKALVQVATVSSATDRKGAAASPIPADKPTKAIPKIQKPKRRETSILSNVALVLLMFAGVGSVAWVGWYLLNRKKPEAIAQAPTPPEIRITKPTLQQTEEGERPNNRAVTAARTPPPSLPEVGMAPDEESAAEVRAMMEEAARQQEMGNSDPNVMSPDANDEVASAPVVPFEDPQMTSAPMVAMTEEDRAKFRSLMVASRRALPIQDFDTFRSSIQEVESLPLDQEAKSKVRRLSQLGQLHEQFILALREGLSSLGGGSTITVGNSPVAIVEASQDRVVIRTAGQNEEYTLSNIPVGLAIAIANLRLDQSHPVDVAARGVFCLLHPRKNNLNERQGRLWVEEASSSDRILPDLLEAITDNY